MAYVLVAVSVAAVLLAFANGANDNAKGVATLIGSRLISMRSAIVYAAVTTMLGSVAAIWLGAELVAKFKGKGIVDDAVWQRPEFAACVGLAAAATVLLATRLSLPISTTHSMVGSIIGIGAAASGLQWVAVWGKFFKPLLIAPLLAMAMAFAVYVVLRFIRRRLRVTHETCVCVEQRYEPVTASADGVLVMRATGVKLTTDQAKNCRQRYQGRVAGVEAQGVLNGAHLLTAGALSFARGLNDTPKIAALLIAVDFVGRVSSLLAVGLAIAVGGLLMVRRVARTMSYRITEMNDGQAFSANAVAAALVTTASLHGMPVSTTHVSCGALFGIGAANRRAHWAVVGQVTLAWVTTLPVAALMGYLAWSLMGPSV